MSVSQISGDDDDDDDDDENLQKKIKNGTN